MAMRLCRKRRVCVSARKRRAALLLLAVQAKQSSRACSLFRLCSRDVMQGAATDAQEDVTAGARREEWSSTQRRAFRVSCTLGASPENVISSAVRALRSVLQSFRMLVPTELMPTII
jgi:hypothetical protein